MKFYDTTLQLGPPSPLIWPVQPNSSSPRDETNVKLTPKEPTRRWNLWSSQYLDKIDVDEMLKHRALNSEKGAKFCGDHRTDCIIQQLDQNKNFLIIFFFLRLWSIVCAWSISTSTCYSFSLRKNRNFINDSIKQLFLLFHINTGRLVHWNLWAMFSITFQKYSNRFILKFIPSQWNASNPKSAYY